MLAGLLYLPFANVPRSHGQKTEVEFQVQPPGVLGMNGRGGVNYFSHSCTQNHPSQVHWLMRVSADGPGVQQGGYYQKSQVDPSEACCRVSFNLKDWRDAVSSSILFGPSLVLQGWPTVHGCSVSRVQFRPP